MLLNPLAFAVMEMPCPARALIASELQYPKLMTIFAGYGLDFHKYLFYNLFIVSGIVPSIIGFIIFHHAVF